MVAFVFSDFIQPVKFGVLSNKTSATEFAINEDNGLLLVRPHAQNLVSAHNAHPNLWLSGFLRKEEIIFALDRYSNSWVFFYVYFQVYPSTSNFTASAINTWLNRNTMKVKICLDWDDK